MLRPSYFPSRKILAINISDTTVKKAPITNARLFNLLYIAADLEEYEIKYDGNGKQYYRKWHNAHVPFI